MQKNTQKDQVILLASHECTLSYITMYKKIKKETAQFADVFCLFHRQTDKVAVEIENLKAFIFDDSILKSCGYHPISNTLVPGSNHFPLLQFAKKYSQYSQYWYIEYDVKFTGRWKTFIKFFEKIKSDLITSHIREYHEEPLWWWWNTLHHPDIDVPNDKRLRSFNPIYRISRQALELIDEALLNKWQGHHEVLIPTLLKQNNMKIADFGGSGQYVLNGCENRFYIDSDHDEKGMMSTGSMRFRPKIKKIEENNKLYHPVKKDIKMSLLKFIKNMVAENKRTGETLKRIKK